MVCLISKDMVDLLYGLSLAVAADPFPVQGKGNFLFWVMAPTINKSMLIATQIKAKTSPYRE